MSQAINAGIATANQLSQAGRETKGDALGKHDFLMLLVTQFKYQDPLNPMDDKEFIAQLAQFNSLEQLMNLNASMENLAAASREQQMMNAANYIGKDVLAGGNSVAKSADGRVSVFYYAIGEDMGQGTIYFYDVNMNQIYAEALGARTAGTYTFEWDGRNYLGALVPEGVYYVRLSCENTDGQPMLTDTAVTGRVTGVATDNGQLFLRMEDGRVVSLNQVREITVASTPNDADDDANVRDALEKAVQDALNGGGSD
jgi:flagellar basal-body rod modification protein FlgD